MVNLGLSNPDITSLTEMTNNITGEETAITQKVEALRQRVSCS